MSKRKKLTDEEKKKRKSEYNSKYREKNKNKINKSQREFRIKNKNRYNEYSIKYRKKNKDKLNKYHREWYKSNSEKAKGYNNNLTKSKKEDRNLKKKNRYHTRYKEQYKSYYKKNSDKICERKRIWRIKNNERENKKVKEYHKKRMKCDIGYRIKYYLHKRFRDAIHKNEKKGIMIKLLGCTIIEFKEYLKSKFTEGMSWKNYGFNGWHIDHKIPCAVFDLSKKEAQEFCFHYSNLQPMWGEENMKKNSKIDIELLRKLDRNILKEKYIKLLDATT